MAITIDNYLAPEAVQHEKAYIRVVRIDIRTETRTARIHWGYYASEEARLAAGIPAKVVVIEHCGLEYEQMFGAFSIARSPLIDPLYAHKNKWLADAGFESSVVGKGETDHELEKAEAIAVIGEAVFGKEVIAIDEEAHSAAILAQANPEFKEEVEHFADEMIMHHGCEQVEKIKEVIEEGGEEGEKIVEELQEEYSHSAMKEKAKQEVDNADASVKIEEKALDSLKAELEDLEASIEGEPDDEQADAISDLKERISGKQDELKTARHTLNELQNAYTQNYEIAHEA